MAVRSRAARLGMVGVTCLVVLGGAGTVLLGGERAGIQAVGSVPRAEVPSTRTLDRWAGPSRVRTPSTTATTAPPATAQTTTPALVTTVPAVTTLPVPQPGPLTAPKAGAYVYDTTWGGVTWKGSGGSTIDVTALPNEGATVVRSILVPFDLSDHATLHSTVAWGPDGATERASNIVPERGVEAAVGALRRRPGRRAVVELRHPPDGMDATRFRTQRARDHL